MTPASPPLGALALAVADIARAAGADLRRRFSQPRTIAHKGAIDLVTDADNASEAIILERLGREFPNAALLSEESGASGGAPDGRLRFVIDPLDGTTNYAHGLPHFSTTIAAEDSLGLLAGVVYDPLRDEMYAAARGAGAFCNGTRLHVTAVGHLGEAFLATGFPYNIRTKPERVLSYFNTIVQKAFAVRRFGSAALDLAYVAQGRYDGYWEDNLKPWDMAAGVLLVQEAGGSVRDYAGNAVDLAKGEAVAGTRGLVEELLAITRTQA